MGNAVKTKQYPVKKPSRSATLIQPGAKELKQSLQRAEALLDAAPVGICDTDLTGKITYVNKRFEEVSGYSREEVVGKNGLKLGMFSSQTLKLFRERIKDRLAGRPPRVLEIQFKCKDGHWIWVALEGQLIRERGIPVGFRIISRDITGQKQAEEALLESEERFRSTVENSHDGIMILDDAYQLIYANDELCRISGYPREEIIGQDFRKFLDEESKQLVADRYIRRQRGEEVPSRYEFNFIRKDGEKRRVEISSSVIKDSAGKIKTVAQILDITERKQIEEALQAEKNKLQSVVDTMEYGLTIQDKDYNIIYQNEPVRMIYGDRLGEKCYRAYEGKDKVCEGCPVEKAFRDGKSHTSERRVVIPSGEVTFWENTANPIRDARGEVVSCLEITRNITERKQAEEALRESQEKLQKMFESVTDGIIVIDLNGVITEVNQRAAEMHGFGSRDELLGKKAFELVVPRDRERAAKSMRQAVKQGAIRAAEYTLLRADGSEFLGELSTNVLKDASGKPAGHVTIVRDITERKRAEEVFKTLAISSPIGVYIVQDRAFQFVSPQFQKLLGYSEDELLGMDSLRLVHPEDREMVREKAIRMLKEGHSSPYEYRYISKDGQTKWVMETVASIQYRGRRATLGNFLDVTERKQAEEALKLQTAYFQQLFDNSPDAIAWLDTTDRFVNVNKAFETLFGYRAEEIKGRLIKETIAPEDRIEEMSASFRTVLSGKVVRQETVRKRKDGNLVDVSIVGYPIRLGNKTVGIYVIYSDITERKRAEEELKLRAQMLDGATDSIFLHDFDENFIYVNEAACRVHGYSREEFLKMKLHQVVVPERASRLDSDKQEIAEKGQAVIESAHLRKDGSIMPVEVHARIIESGGTKRILAVIRDITERKRAEEERRELEQRAQLTSRLTSIGEMAAGIAHEINNPLTAVIGFAQLLMEGNIPDDVKEDLSVIYKEAQRAAEVARNLLVFARRREPGRQPTDINSAIHEMLKLRAYEQRVNNIQVNTRFAPALPTVMADYSQLQQVFLNIIINAEAAMLEAHNGGTLTVTTQKVNSTIKVSFTDNGPGIAKEILERVFDPFFTTKEVGKGTGLGLSVCHGIVVQHGGRIYARSKLGKGATFVVELPINAH